MSESPLVVTLNAGTATLRLNRPEHLNALDVASKEALLAALRDVATNHSVRCVVLTGTGRAFCVGQDLREHATLLRDGSDAVLRTVPEHYNPIAQAIHDLDKPVVAAVNGVAAGAGASLAFLADLRLVSASAGFNLAFTGVALSADTGSSWTLPRLVGPTRAMDLLLNPRTISADESLALGLATEVIPDDAFAARVEAVAARLAQGPTVAYAAVRQAVGFSASHDLAESLAFEAEMMERTGATSDHRSAVEAFLAKQLPAYEGR